MVQLIEDAERKEQYALKVHNLKDGLIELLERDKQKKE
ncbi:hypothetical protein AB7X35_12470 [Proteus mirabilis]